MSFLIQARTTQDREAAFLLLGFYGVGCIVHSDGENPNSIDIEVKTEYTEGALYLCEMCFMGAFHQQLAEDGSMIFTRQINPAF